MRNLQFLYNKNCKISKWKLNNLNYLWEFSISWHLNTPFKSELVKTISILMKILEWKISRNKSQQVETLWIIIK